MNITQRWPTVFAVAGAAMVAALVGPAVETFAADAQRARPPEPIDVAATMSLRAVKQPLIGIAVAGSRLVTVGQKGHILYSDDGARTWRQSTVPVSVDLVAVQFPSPQTGWATGHDGVVLRSDDAGASWSVVLEGRRAAKLLVDFYSDPKRQSEPQVAAALKESKAFAVEQGARPFLDLWFSDDKTGFIVGAWGLILKTHDGGATWEPWIHRIDNPDSAHLNSIRPAGSSLWIAGERGLLWRLDADSDRFVKASAPEGGSLFGLATFPEGIVAYGLLGRAIVTHDSGRTWAAAKGLASSGLTGSAVLADGRVVLVDVGAGVWVSHDRGDTFAALTLTEPMPFAGVAPVSGASSPRLALVGLGGVRLQTIAP